MRRGVDRRFQTRRRSLVPPQRSRRPHALAIMAGDSVNWHIGNGARTGAGGSGASVRGAPTLASLRRRAVARGCSGAQRDWQGGDGQAILSLHALAGRDPVTPVPTGQTAPCGGRRRRRRSRRARGAVPDCPVQSRGPRVRARWGSAVEVELSLASAVELHWPRCDGPAHHAAPAAICQNCARLPFPSKPSPAVDGAKPMPGPRPVVSSFLLLLYVLLYYCRRGDTADIHSRLFRRGTTAMRSHHGRRSSCSRLLRQSRRGPRLIRRRAPTRLHKRTRHSISPAWDGHHDRLATHNPPRPRA